MSTRLGLKAEALVANYFEAKDFVILARNWRVRTAEIDIIAQKGSHLYFVEVKYRGNTSWGKGDEYVGPQKLKQMHYATRLWLAANNWPGDYELLVATVDGSDEVVIFECS